MMKIYENMWKYMKIYENIWKYMKIFENIWKYMKKCENIRKYMKIFCTSWECNLWKHKKYQQNTSNENWKITFKIEEKTQKNVDKKLQNVNTDNENDLLRRQSLGLRRKLGSYNFEAEIKTSRIQKIIVQNEIILPWHWFLQQKNKDSKIKAFLTTWSHRNISAGPSFPRYKKIVRKNTMIKTG